MNKGKLKNQTKKEQEKFPLDNLIPRITSGNFGVPKYRPSLPLKVSYWRLNSLLVFFSITNKKFHSLQEPYAILAKLIFVIRITILSENSIVPFHWKNHRRENYKTVVVKRCLFYRERIRHQGMLITYRS